MVLFGGYCYYLRRAEPLKYLWEADGRPPGRRRAACGVIGCRLAGRAHHFTCLAPIVHFLGVDQSGKSNWNHPPASGESSRPPVFIPIHSTAVRHKYYQLPEAEHTTTEMEQDADNGINSGATANGQGRGGENDDNDYSDGVYEFKKPPVYLFDLDEDGALLKIERNDPTVQGLYHDDEYEDDDDASYYRRLGDAIGRNVHLKELILSLRMHHFVSMCSGIARNRSIKHLHLTVYFDYVDRVETDRVFRILLPFFEHNTNLRYIYFDGFDADFNSPALISALSKCPKLMRLKIGRGGSDLAKFIQSLQVHRNLLSLSLDVHGLKRAGHLSLAELMSNPGATIRDLEVGSPSDDVECASIFSRALVNNGSLRRLNLRWGKRVTPEGWRILSKALSDPHCTLETLDLGYGTSIMSCGMLCTEGVTALGTALTANKLLKHLIIGSKRVCEEGWLAFSQCLRSPTVALESLFLEKCKISDQMMVAIVGSLAGNVTLKKLGFGKIELITPAGWAESLRLLLNPGCTLEELIITASNIDDGVVAVLVELLAGTRSLRTLGLQNSQSVSSAGWMSLSSALQQPSCALKKINLTHDFSHDGMIYFVQALATNTCLEELNLCGHYVSMRSWNILSRVLCDESSILNTFSSNHVLNEVNAEDVPDSIVSLLQMNKNPDKASVARQKMIALHFSAISEYTLDLETTVLPRTIEWIGRDDLGYSLMYNLLRGMPSLFGLL